MTAYLILLQMMALNLLGKITAKLQSRVAEKQDFSATLVVILLTALFSCGYFGLTARFQLATNGITLGFSVVYAVLVALSLICSIKILQYASIAAVNVIGNAGSLITSAIAGFFLFDDKAEGKLFLRVGLMVLAVVLIFLEQRRRTNVSMRNSTSGFIFFIALNVLSGFGVTVTCKYYSINPDVSSNEIFFFYTNVFLFVGILIILITRCLKSANAVKATVHTLRPKYVLLVFGNTLISNIHALLAMSLMALSELNWYTAVTSAGMLVLSTVASVIFRERLGVFSYLAAIISVIVIFI